MVPEARRWFSRLSAGHEIRSTAGLADRLISAATFAAQDEGDQVMEFIYFVLQR